MKGEQKFLTEVALLQATNGVAVLKPSDLYRMDQMMPKQLSFLEKAHIYFVCQRPRVRITQAIKPTSTTFDLTISISNSVNETNKSFTINDMPENLTDMILENSGSSFRFRRDDGEETGEYPIEMLLLLPHTNTMELSDLEVVYIGQALGDNKQRSAMDRLLSHSTLQRVLAEQAQSSWWMETILILFTYPESPTLISKMDGRGTPKIAGNHDWDHFSTIRDSPLSDEQLTTIAEASLIKHFQPKYNKHFKGEYPTSSMKHLHDAYRLDYNAIITEIDTEDINITIRSSNHPASHHHIAQFDLHDPNDRLSFFELSGLKDKK